MQRKLQKLRQSDDEAVKQSGLILDFDEIARKGSMSREEITIAKAGKPHARLVPLEPAKERPLGFVHVPFDESFFEPLPDAELSAWE